MYRPANNRTPSLLVEQDAKTMREYRLGMRDQVQFLAEREDNPDLAAREVGELLVQAGMLTVAPEDLSSLLTAVETDGTLDEFLGELEARPPLVQADQELAELADNLSLLEWAENLQVDHNLD